MITYINIGKTPSKVCLLPLYTPIIFEEVLDEELDDEEMIELFFTGKVEGKTKTKTVARLNV